jgi:hypothetical protein
MIQGLRLREALNIDRDPVIHSLGGHVSERHHAGQLCGEALRAALRNYLTGKYSELLAKKRRARYNEPSA